MKAENIVALPGREVQGIETGTVNGGADGRYVVYGSSGVFSAEAAFSCLVQPQVGDKVMYSRAPDGSCYILSILERPTGDDAVIAFPGDVVIDAASGRFTVASAEGIDMTTASSVNMLSADVNVSAVNGRFNVVKMQATGDSLTGNIGKVRLFSEAIEVIAQRAIQRVKNSIRMIEQIEHVTAGTIMQSVKQLFSVRAKQSSVTAEKDVKIDGKRVHIG